MAEFTEQDTRRRTPTVPTPDEQERTTQQAQTDTPTDAEARTDAVRAPFSTRLLASQKTLGNQHTQRQLARQHSDDDDERDDPAEDAPDNEALLSIGATTPPADDDSTDSPRNQFTLLSSLHSRIALQRAPDEDEEQSATDTDVSAQTSAPVDDAQSVEATDDPAASDRSEGTDAPTDDASATDQQATDDTGDTGESATSGPSASQGDTPAPTSGNEQTSASATTGTAPVGGAPAATDQEILPDPTLTEQDQSRLTTVQDEANTVATEHTEMPSSTEQTTDARAAVTEPEQETQGKAEEDLFAELGSRPRPSPEVLELCDRIRQAIRERRPPDEDSLTSADPEAMAKDAGKELDGEIDRDVERVDDEYDELDTDPSGQREKEPQPPEDVPEEAKESAQVDAKQAVPEGNSPDEISLDQQVEENQAQIDAATSEYQETADLVESGPLQDARDAQSELEESARVDTTKVLARQQSIQADAQASMDELQARALQSMREARRTTVTENSNQRDQMIQSEEDQRTQVGQQANQIYADAQQRVDELMAELPTMAMERWEAGVAILSTRFKQSLAKVDAWIEERHSGVGGFFNELGDAIFGLPDWITDEYDRAEQAFGDGVCNLLTEISTEVDSVVKTCEAIIANARQQIRQLFASLPENLQGWAQEQQAQFDNKLNALNQQVQTTRKTFTQELTQKAAGAVQEMREEVHALREKAKGLIGRIQASIEAFIEDPARFIINGLLEIVGIAKAAFWGVVNRIGDSIDAIAAAPLTFANNLVNALGTGFQLFFDNIPTHLLDGMFSWLFSRLSDVGVEAPRDFSLKSLVTFFMQVMGFTWDRIKRLLAKRVGEENVEMVEKAWSLMSELIEMGPEGIFSLVEETLDPQNILDVILETAIEFIVETLIKQVAMRLLGLLNPAGAVLQAIEVIYKVLSWLFENAARIFGLIETVVGGIADIINGNIGGMAKAIEESLARLLPIVIDFLADFLGLGNLPKKVANAIENVQEFVEEAIDEALDFIAKKAKKLLAKIGLGDEDEETAKDRNSEDERTEKQKQEALNQATMQAHKMLKNEKKVAQEVELDIHDILVPKYRLTNAKVVKHGRVDDKSPEYKYQAVLAIDSLQAETPIVFKRPQEAQVKLDQAVVEAQSILNAPNITPKEAEIAIQKRVIEKYELDGVTVKRAGDPVEKGEDTFDPYVAVLTSDILSEETDVVLKPAGASSAEAQEAVTDLKQQSQQHHNEEGEITKEEAQKVAANVYEAHSDTLTHVTVVDGEDTWDYDYDVIQRSKTSGGKKEDEKPPENPIDECTFVKVTTSGSKTTYHFRKTGDIATAEEDFNSIVANSTKIPIGATGQTSDGRTANYRSKSSEGSVTLEIQTKDERGRVVQDIKIRYQAE